MAKWGNQNTKNNGADRGPLRKLIEIVLIGEGRDKWLLACGHQIWVNDSTIYRARCWRCKHAKHVVPSLLRERIERCTYEKAKARVENSPKLAPHADFILADWPEGEEHWQWVCTTSEDEILDWVEAGK